MLLCRFCKAGLPPASQPRSMACHKTTLKCLPFSQLRGVSPLGDGLWDRAGWAGCGHRTMFNITACAVCSCVAHTSAGGLPALESEVRFSLVSLPITGGSPEPSVESVEWRRGLTSFLPLLDSSPWTARLLLAPEAMSPPHPSFPFSDPCLPGCSRVPNFYCFVFFLIFI